MKKIIVDTDLLVGHVVQGEPADPSDLRRLLGTHFCYTTVFNAIEAFGLCRTEDEREAIEHSMYALKILGLNAKSGKNLGALVSSSPGKEVLHLLIAGVCMESRLPLVTRRPRTFASIPGLTVLAPGEVLKSGNT